MSSVNFNHHHPLRSPEGFTLIEIAVALAVVGIMAGAFITARSMMKSAKVARVVNDIAAIRTAADRYIKATGAVDYSSLGFFCNRGGIQLLVSRGYLPASMLNASNNPFGANYYVGYSARTALIVSARPIPASPEGARIANALSSMGTAVNNYTGCGAPYGFFLMLPP